jgi:hypothetical protein
LVAKNRSIQVQVTGEQGVALRGIKHRLRELASQDVIPPREGRKIHRRVTEGAVPKKRNAAQGGVTKRRAVKARIKNRTRNHRHGEEARSNRQESEAKAAKNSLSSEQQ